MKNDPRRAGAQQSSPQQSRTEQPTGEQSSTDSPVPGHAAAPQSSTQNPITPGPDQQLEGEGSYSASRRYREGLEESVQRGDSDKLAEEAVEALDGAEGEELRQAEEQAKQGPTAKRTATPKGAAQAAKPRAGSTQDAEQSPSSGPQSGRRGTQSGQRFTQPHPSTR